MCFYILRVGVIDQMTEPTQRVFLVNLGKQLQSHDASSSMKISTLRTLSYALTTLGEVTTSILPKKTAAKEGTKSHVKTPKSPKKAAA